MWRPVDNNDGGSKGGDSGSSSGHGGNNFGVAGCFFTLLVFFNNFDTLCLETHLVQKFKKDEKIHCSTTLDSRALWFLPKV